jgi:hypothetical protein
MKTGSLSLIALCVLQGVSVMSQTPATQTSPSVVADQAKANGTNANQSSKPARLSTGLDDIVKLAQSGVEESVILTFIQSSPVAYRPSAQEVIKLRELGVSSQIITALLRRGNELRERAAQAQKESAPAQPAAPPASNGQATSTVPSASVYYAPSAYPVNYAPVYATYPAYSYSAVSYGYGGCYYPRYYYPRYYSSCYPSVGFYGGYYPRVSFGVRFGGGGFYGHRGGFRHCR